MTLFTFLSYRTFGKNIFLVILLFCHLLAHSQTIDSGLAIMNIDTVSIINANPKEASYYSTFANSIFHQSSIKYLDTDSSQHCSCYSFPVSILINNKNMHSILIDSLYIKIIDKNIGQTHFIFYIYQNGEVYQSMESNIVARRNNYYVIRFNDVFQIPPGESYFSFTFKTDRNSISIRTNTAVSGYCYSYNSKKNEFKIIEDKSLREYFAPQIKLFYSSH